MDGYEATRIVYSRIQKLDPENAPKIMGLLLIQDHGDKEMIRLAFGPETVLHSLLLKAKKELGLLPVTSLSTSPFYNSSSPSSCYASLSHSLSMPSSYATLPGNAIPTRFRGNGMEDSDELIRPNSSYGVNLGSSSSSSSSNSSSFFSGVGGGGGDPSDELFFLNDLAMAAEFPPKMSKNGGELFYLQESPLFDGDQMLFPYSHHRRSFSVADMDSVKFGWKPCLYFARGYCKNGTTCRFLHGFPDNSTADLEEQSQELVRSKSQRLVPNNLNLFHQSENQSSAMNLGEEWLKFGSRSTARMERNDLGSVSGMINVNPASRQIYLTFPADSTFREEDVSGYFSLYGPVQDVRIPYQQKRMFGFVTFVFPETVKLILAKGNPHFVCDARVLVKPYKEKSKLPEKKQQGERGDLSSCTTPTSLDYDLHQMGARMLYDNSQEVLMRRKIEDQAELQQAIELHGRRLMELQLQDVRRRNLSVTSPRPSLSPDPFNHSDRSSPEAPHEGAEKCLSPAATVSPCGDQQHLFQKQLPFRQAPEKESIGGEISVEEKQQQDSFFQESRKCVEHNLPDSPFASPTKSLGDQPSFFSLEAAAAASERSTSISAAGTATASNNNLMAFSTSSPLLPATSTLDMASLKSCFFQMPRFSSGQGTVGL